MVVNKDHRSFVLYHESQETERNMKGLGSSFFKGMFSVPQHVIIPQAEDQALSIWALGDIQDSNDSNLILQML